MPLCTLVGGWKKHGFLSENYSHWGQNPISNAMIIISNGHNAIISNSMTLSEICIQQGRLKALLLVYDALMKTPVFRTPS